jgi:CDGSH iron-sulfur domain-containing protein 3
MSSYERDPWAYSDTVGHLVADGKIVILGYRLHQKMPLGPPRCASRLPAVVQLEPGRYSWCTCGHSRSQPFCDSTHCSAGQVNGRTGYDFKVLAQCEVALCRCKQTSQPPFCDGAHACGSLRPAGAERPE